MANPQWRDESFLYLLTTVKGQTSAASVSSGTTAFGSKSRTRKMPVTQNREKASETIVIGSEKATLLSVLRQLMRDLGSEIFASGRDMPEEAPSTSSSSSTQAAVADKNGAGGGNSGSAALTRSRKSLSTSGRRVRLRSSHDVGLGGMGIGVVAGMQVEDATMEESIRQYVRRLEDREAHAKKLWQLERQDARKKRWVRMWKKRTRTRQGSRAATNTFLSVQQAQQKSFIQQLIDNDQSGKALRQQWHALVRKVTHESAVWPLKGVDIRWKLDPTEGIDGPYNLILIVGVIIYILFTVYQFAGLCWDSLSLS
jgi:hypothetical protein